MSAISQQRLNSTRFEFLYALGKKTFEFKSGLKASAKAPSEKKRLNSNLL